MDTCPTCGAPLPEDLVVWDFERRTFVVSGEIVQFARIPAKVMDALWRTRNKGGVVSRKHLHELVYYDDINGGPENESTLTIHIRHVRQKLERVGYTVTKNYGFVGYRLVKKGKPRRGYLIKRRGK